MVSSYRFLAQRLTYCLCTPQGASVLSKIKILALSRNLEDALNYLGKRVPVEPGGWDTIQFVSCLTLSSVNVG
jgi:hypothetical protein